MNLPWNYFPNARLLEYVAANFVCKGALHRRFVMKVLFSSQQRTLAQLESPSSEGFLTTASLWRLGLMEIALAESYKTLTHVTFLFTCCPVLSAFRSLTF